MIPQKESPKWRIIPFDQKDPFFNMAVDEAIFRSYEKLRINTLRLYAWIPSTVSIGLHQNLNAEVELSFVKKMGFQTVRRISGGGAVFHDAEGELTYSIVTAKKELSSQTVEESYYEIIDLLFRPLRKLGVEIQYDQIHCPSVFSHGRKISGNAQARSGDVILQHGTILIDYDPEIMYSALKAHPGKSTSEMVASVYQKVTTISQEINKKMTPGILAKYIIEDLISNFPMKFAIGDLKKEEQSLATSLIKEKYKTEDWLMGLKKK
jgi:lipoate-protein ligase A